MNINQQIIDNLHSPEELEKIYREHKREFSDFFKNNEGNYDSELYRFWQVRLAAETSYSRHKALKSDIIFLMLVSLFSGLLLKLPDFFAQLDENSFYLRNLSLILFNALILYAFWQLKLFKKHEMLIYSISIVALAVYVNLLPVDKSDAARLALLHVPVLLWYLFGLVLVSFDRNNLNKRIGYIRYSGEYLVMTGLILIGGALLTVLTINMFSAIGMNIENFWMEYVVIFGGAAVPVVSAFLIHIYPDVTGKITPVLARIFSPLALVTLAVYLIFILMGNSNVMKDRNLLMVLNVVLFAVLVLVVFSISEIDKSKKKNAGVFVLFLLTLLAILVNVVALIAIVSRLFNGFTPNRTVVLGFNVLIFINLILLLPKLFRSFSHPEMLEEVEQSVARYLNVYFLWTLMVVFVLPVLFRFR
jgi:hypothetical protein